MRYIIDHDFHMHSSLSLCSGDPGQTPEAMLKYAEEHNLKAICITDHYWDELVPCNTAVNRWYERQNHAHVTQILPLPQPENVKLLFGCEADLDSDDVIGISKERFDAFDFIVLSTTHLHHMSGPRWENLSNAGVAEKWVERFDAVLNADLPFGKVGIAHPTCRLINMHSRKDFLEILSLIPQSELERLFTKAAKVGLGIEINASTMQFEESETDTILRMYRIAKDCGCKFYLGSDAHTREDMKKLFPFFDRAIDLLDLQESDKFIIKA
ncbi:MAG: PHP domain-containing protein [Oscillospiraceae bacterium]|nr:PHP domain-containing protein [Oscillospiraceae bacterium]